jgi:hypothetical protein
MASDLILPNVKLPISFVHVSVRAPKWQSGVVCDSICGEGRMSASA